jgi:HEAT repeat protein
MLLRAPDLLLDKRALIDAGAGIDGAALRAVLADRSLGRYVRMRAASSLGWFANPAVRSALAALVASRDDPEVRIQAIAALGYLGDRAALQRARESVDPPVRAAAERALAR